MLTLDREKTSATSYDEVWVAWEHWKDRGKKIDRYFKDELRLLQSNNQ